MPSVLVTGAGRGIGEAIALRLAGNGWTVLAGVRDDLSGERLAAQDGRITPVRLDITDADHIAALADQLPARLDAVVNNAAIGVLGPVEAVSIPAFRHQFEVNLFGQVAVTQAVLPQIRAAHGRVVFISSTGGRAPVLMEGAYCASKFALEGLADVLRVELRPWRIHVSVVEPGPTDTGAWRHIQSLLDDMEQGMSATHRELYEQHIRRHPPAGRHAAEPDRAAGRRGQGRRKGADRTSPPCPLRRRRPGQGDGHDEHGPAHPTQ